MNQSRAVTNRGEKQSQSNEWEPGRERLVEDDAMRLPILEEGGIEDILDNGMLKIPLFGVWILYSARHQD
jgi:hypothetical protein